MKGPSKLSKIKYAEHNDSFNEKVEEEEVEKEEIEKEEVQLDNCKIESPIMNREKKRKKVTEDELSEAVTKKKFKNGLYKQPTVEELNQLRETENLFHSNLFRLQIEEILNEVKLKTKYKALFEIWFKKLKATIESIEETEEIPLVNNNVSDKLDIYIPAPHVPEETRGVFKFLKPSNISVIGSYNSECILGPTVTVDIMVEMPAGLFRKQDYQNYIYFRKRATYLAFITSVIGSDLAESKKFIGDDLRLSLKLRPSGKLNKKIDVVIHTSLQETSFKLNRFLPEKNSVRPAWYFDKKSLVDATASLPPTPRYNSLVLHDLVMSNINSEMAQAIREYPNLRDGIILLKIWLHQRELSKGYDGFTGHIVTMFVIYLLRMKKLNTFMSSYQVVRNVWICLAQGNWCKDGISMCKDKDNQKQVSHYHNYYDCVFLDSTGYHNFAANLSKDTFAWVQREADLCLNHLDSIHMDNFQALFMRSVPFHKAFDQILCFQNKTILEKILEKSSIDDKINYGPDKRNQVIKLLVEVLKKGLEHRINRLCILPNVPKEWECSQDIPDDTGKLIIGLELNPEICFGIVDKGPEANLPEAVDFRNFWGVKSELRRFKDGSIREAVVWSKGKSFAHKRIICKKIIAFLLKTKFNILKDQYLYVADQVEDLLKLHKYKITHFVYGTGEEATLKALQAFNILEKNLMSLNDMPLTINGVHGSSPIFRYTEVFPPLATVHRSINDITEDKNCLILSKKITKCPAYVHALDATLQLSISGKWPEELEAIRKTKTAFHIQIADCLRKQYQLKAQANPSYVDVYQDGFVFRLRVAHQKEIALVKQVKEDGVIKYKDNEESIELENKLFHLPKLSSALHGLHSQQPSFGPACCLAKRWLSAQLLDDTHVPEVVVELLMASIYLTPEPYKPAQMPQVAFLRFLEVVARSHWNTDPVIVNFNGEMTKEEISAIEMLFNTTRASLPPLFVSTPYDQQKSLWTRKAPSQLILNRMSILAKESLKLFDDLLFNNTVLDIKPIFRPSLKEYDCLLYLKTNMNPRRLQAVDVSNNAEIVDLHPYKAHSLQKIPVTDFDPVQCFLKDLRDGYGDYALFFHDTYGGTVIGVLLKPAALEYKDFKVADVDCRKRNGHGKLVLNVSAMIEDFYVLGKGIIRAINVPSKGLSLTTSQAST